ncbi:MAG TPA: hypothetical protein DCX65_07155, partial [Spirochaetaceae bacterium]|nr:hypothetical protein [Spirochaetaceae bacterium]
KALVLLSDGEDNVGRVHPADVVALAAENGVSLAVFGLGTKGMVSVDYVDPFTGERRRGNYQSDFDEAALRAVAGAGAGYFALADSSGNLASLQRWLRVSQPAAVAAVSQVTLRQSLASGFFLLACLLALAAWLARAVWFGGVV